MTLLGADINLGQGHALGERRRSTSRRSASSRKKNLSSSALDGDAANRP